MFRIERSEGSCWTASCMCSDVEFNVLSVESEEEVFIVKPKSEVPKSKVPKSRPKGLGLTLESHGPPTPPTHL